MSHFDLKCMWAVYFNIINAELSWAFLHHTLIATRNLLRGSKWESPPFQPPCLLLWHHWEDCDKLYDVLVRSLQCDWQEDFTMWGENWWERGSRLVLTFLLKINFWRREAWTLGIPLILPVNSMNSWYLKEDADSSIYEQLEYRTIWFHRQ